MNTSSETTPTSGPENHRFQAEVGQLLHIVTHSLYTDKEIFIRELISNAADALEKFRHLHLTEKNVFDDTLPLEINITTDDQAGTITIQDFGLGMTRAELIENIGTIANSGSRAFLKAMQAAREAAGTGAAPEAGLNLIGQFGVGFYSVFMVAKKVTLYTHSWQPEAEHLMWSSEGQGSYSIEVNPGQRRGCKIAVQLNDSEKEFSQAWRVKEIIQRYSKFVPFPLNLNGERVNTVQAIWLRSKAEVKDDEYTEFYKYQADALEGPRHHLHFSSDAPLELHALLFVPKENPEKFGFGRVEPGVSLYCKKILIDAKPDGLLPEWLRFLRGVVDCSDLPLNISRETMQDSALLRKINKVLSTRFLKFLEEEAEKRPDGYVDFYRHFGIYLKEGITTDFANRDRLAKLLRFETSQTEAGKLTALPEVVARVPAEAKEIYFVHGPNRAALEQGPYLEAFRARGREVIFLYEPVDEFVMHHLHEFDGKKLISADQSGLDLGDTVPSTEALPPLTEAVAENLCRWLEEGLTGIVKVVRPSRRLVDSPAAAFNADRVMSPAMRRWLRAMKEEGEETTAIDLEINLRHPLIHKLEALRQSNPETARLLSEQLCDNALLAAGYLDDPRRMVGRLHRLLARIN